MLMTHFGPTFGTAVRIHKALNAKLTFKDDITACQARQKLQSDTGGDNNTGFVLIIEGKKEGTYGLSYKSSWRKDAKPIYKTINFTSISAFLNHLKTSSVWKDWIIGLNEYDRNSKIAYEREAQLAAEERKTKKYDKTWENIQNDVTAWLNSKGD